MNQTVAFLVDLDHQALFAVNHLQGNAVFDAFFLYGTLLGTTWLAFPLLAVGLWLRHRRHALQPLLIASGVTALGGLLVGLTKLLVARERPPLALAADIRLLGPALYRLSFPSGHTFAVFAILGFLSVFDRYMALGWSLVAVWVAFSRVYLGVHYPSDVIAAAVFGFVFARWMTRAVFSRLKKRNRSHEPN